MQQKKIVVLFNSLFNSGFNLTEIVAFLRRSQLLADAYTDQMQEGLLAGKAFSQIIGGLGFSSHVVTQLSLAEVHGNLSLCLDKIDTYLSEVLRIRKKLIEVASYPLVLLVFLVLIMLGLKNYLLPQLSTDGRTNLATKVLEHFPLVVIGLILGFFITVLIVRVWVNHTAPIRAFNFLARLPGCRTLIRLYLTGYYAREWGNLIGQGLEMPDILELMKAQPNRLFRDIGQDMSESLSNGQSFDQKVKDYIFFEKELSLIIEYGEAKSKLGQELEIYAQDCWDRFFTRLNRLMQLIQPLVFIFVALVIVLVYAAMLLPIYNNMEVHL